MELPRQDRASNPGASKTSRSRRNRNRKKKEEQVVTKTTTRNPSGRKGGKKQTTTTVVRNRVKQQPRKSSARTAQNQLVKSPLKRAAMAMALQYSLPEGGRPFRWASAFSIQPTAVASPWTRYDITCSTASSDSKSKVAHRLNGREISEFRHKRGKHVDPKDTEPTTSTPIVDNSSTLLYLFRSLALAYIQYNANTSSEIGDYAFLVMSDDGTVSETASTETVGDTTPFELVMGVVASGTSFHDITWFPGSWDHGEDRFIWLDNGCTVKFTLNASGVTSDNECIIYVYILVNGEKLLVDQLDFSSGTAESHIYTAAPGFDRYHCFSYYNAEGTAPALWNILYENPGVPTFEHHCAPGYALNRSSVQMGRVLAASACISNGSALLDLQGYVCGAQIPGNNDWDNFLTYKSVSALPGSTELPAKTGIFGFLKPSAQIDFEFVQEIEADTNGNITASYWNLNRQNDFLVFVSNINDTSGRTLRARVSFGIEFSTEDTWRTTIPPTPSTHLQEMALLELRDIPQFQENPLHIKDIWDKIVTGTKTVLGAVKKYGPLAGQVAENLADLFA